MNKINNSKKVSFFLVCAALFMGIIFGSTAAGKLSAEEVSEISSALTLSGEKSAHIFFKQSLFNNLILSFCIWFSGLTIAGIFLSVIIVMLKGYSVGLTVGSFLKIAGGRGFLAALGGVLPHNIIALSATVFLAMLSITFSKEITKGNIKKTFLVYTLASFILTAFMCVGSIVEGYISFPLLKIIVGEGL